MTTSRHDMRHGRQGGRIVDFAPPAKARPCSECGRPMMAGQRSRHHACDPNSTVGMRCTCPPGCTDTNIGDQGTCDDDCQPCRMNAGTPHKFIYGKRNADQP